MLFENYAKDFPNQRLFHLNRSGFAGSQRYSIFPWSGDVGRSWSGLQAQLPVMLGMSMCGVPYIHADAGGFALGENDAELYVRWLQFATFTPVFRPHGTALYEWDANAISFPSEAALFDEPYKSLAKQAIIERYKMLPYNYTLAYRHTKYAEPLVKPLLFNYSTDTTAIKIEDEYLYGDNILVAPVTSSKQILKNIYLPAGNWYNAETNKLHSGNSFIKINVEEYRKAVFYKEGAFIPQYNCNGENTAEIDRKKLTVIYVPAEKKSTFEMYDDDGENKNSIAQNQFELIKFTASGKTNNSLAITMQNNNGNYKNKPKERFITLSIPTINQKPKAVLINGIAQKNVVFENETVTVNCTLKSTIIKMDIKW
jgi:oligosaccharide 4-alpha-D-glucosyltransferase